ncbi:MAG: DUF2252 domain-containing protein [Acidobacteriota bacterium]|nr:DUF2252 domain-containing protein [Acidobacteriota bacterium]
MSIESDGDRIPPSQQQRLSLGRQARNRVSRSKLVTINPKKRGFDPIAILLQSARHRVPRLLPVKYQRMSASPFAFFRGAVSIMAADLGAQPHTDLTVQLCGDAHVQNLGSFEAPDGRIVFDINDFDETIAGPWEWDVKRMAASIVLAGLESDHNEADSSRAVEDFAASYVTTIEELADRPILAAARFQVHRLGESEAISSALRQAERAQPGDLLAKYTAENAKGRPRFKRVEHVLWRITGEPKKDILCALPSYRKSLPAERLHLFDFFIPRDVAFKVVGTGSVGLRDYVVLMEGNGPGDPLFLQIKQEVASAYAPYLKPGNHVHQGRRVAEGLRKIQPISDLLLGWTRIEEEDFLVRQLNDHKGKVDLANLGGEGLNKLAGIAGVLLARGHARSGDALAIKGYIGTPDKVIKSIVHYGTEYADLTRADFELFRKAIEQGRIKVAS